MSEHCFFGIYRGKVVDNNDPENRNRLAVQVPSVTGTATLRWAWPCSPVGTVAGDTLTPGTPSVGGGVWIMFEGGDPEYPVWVGVFGEEGGST